MTVTLRTEDGRPVLRIQRRLTHPPEKAWRAITEPEHLDHWFPSEVDIDLAVGGDHRGSLTAGDSLRPGGLRSPADRGPLSWCPPPCRAPGVARAAGAVLRRPVRHAGRVLPRFPFLDSPGAIAFAHRGASPDGLENTLAAVQRVVGLGFGYLETDVRASLDGVALLMHDPTLDRTTDRAGRVQELPWARIAAARVGGREPVPRLDDLLGSFPELRVNLHIKTAGAIGPTVAAVRRTGALDRVCAAAFSDRYVALARTGLGPGLCTALGTRGVLGLRLASLREIPGAGGPVPIAPCAQVPARVGALRVVDRRFVDTAHRRGVQVHVWTVNDATEMHRLLDLGVDGLMSDEAETLRDVLIARGVWSGGRAA